MVQIWLMDPSPCGDLRLPHYYFPPKLITPDQLKQQTGVLYWKVNVNDGYAMKNRLDRIYLERGYTHTYEDNVVFKADMTPDYENKMKLQFESRISRLDTARLIIEGSGFCDVQHDSGKWYRIHVEVGDFIVVPPGRRYRLITDTKFCDFWLWVRIMHLVYRKTYDDSEELKQGLRDAWTSIESNTVENAMLAFKD